MPKNFPTHRLSTNDEPVKFATRAMTRLVFPLVQLVSLFSGSDCSLPHDAMSDADLADAYVLAPDRAFDATRGRRRIPRWVGLCCSLSSLVTLSLSHIWESKTCTARF
jgi:hypothetical protein